MTEQPAPEQEPAKDEQSLTEKLKEQEQQEIEQRRGERGQTNAPDRDDPTTADAGTEAPS